MGVESFNRHALESPGTTFTNAVTLSAGATATTGNITATAGDLVITAPTTPASASATGTIGTIAWDTGFLYVCTATDTWERVAVASW